MEIENPPLQNNSENSSTESVSQQYINTSIQNNHNGRRFQVIGFLVVVLSISGYLLTFGNIQIFQKTQEKRNLPISPSTTEQKISTQLSPIFQAIQTRQHVHDQKNKGGNGIIASGFLDPQNLLKKPVGRSYFTVYAQENNERPYLFYISQDRLSIKAFDVGTAEEKNLLSVQDIPNISVKNGTAFTRVYFINSSKKLVFQLQERLDDNPDTDETIINNLQKFKVSFKIYDTINRQTIDIVSMTGTGGSIAGWQGLSISPNENYIFTFYNNQSDQDPFAEVEKALNSENYASNVTYFFYNLIDNTLKKFKSIKQLSGQGTISSSWQNDSSAVLLGYVKPTATLPSPSVFVLVFPDGQAQVISENDGGINNFSQTQYIPELKRVFYIGSLSTNMNASLFGYFDQTSQSFIPITESGRHSLNFIYDYNSGFIYDSFEQVAYDTTSGGIDNKTLNYYDLKSGISRTIISQNLNMINFNGDYTHLLVSSYIDNKNSKLYDLDIVTSELKELNSIPYVFSPFPFK